MPPIHSETNPIHILPIMADIAGEYLCKIINMKKIFFSLLLLAEVIQADAQIKWMKDTSLPQKEEWNNYSTSFIGDLDHKKPILVAAIPYNGTYSNMDDANAPFDVSSGNSLFRFKSSLSEKGRMLQTYDSGMVYFLTPGIFRENTDEYEYRILLNNKTEIIHWSSINQFSDLTLNNFKKGFGFLGGYKAGWGNFISAEIRKKNTDTSFAFSSVYWKENKPAVQQIFTAKNLNDFFSLLQRPWNDKTIKKDVIVSPQLSAGENMIIYYLSAGIFKKEALEYQLVKDDKIIHVWGANDYDNNFIWLKELSPGKYKLSIRYTRQRHNVSEYRFEIKPQWHQTAWFKIITGSLLAAFIGFVVLLVIVSRQKRKFEKEKFEKEKLKLEMQSVRQQLNPHFVFNALNAVQALVNRNETDAANKYLAAFADILRQSLYYGEKDIIPLKEEIKMLRTYLLLEQLRFQFAWSVTADENLDVIEIPVLLLQPLVENSVKHGMSSIKGQGKIDIHFRQQENDIIISVTDNGKGFDADVESKGYGLKLTRQRIDMFNRMNDAQKINLFFPRISQGTKIEMIFSNWL